MAINDMDLQDVSLENVVPAEAIIQPIGEGQVAEAEKTRKKYEDAKATVIKKITEAFEWYRLNQQDYMPRTNDTEIASRSAWTLNVIANKHADAMDNIPSANILPREEGDIAEAEKLKAIIPVILAQAKFEETWNKATLYEMICGTMCIATVWDSSLNNGIGDVAIQKVDLLSLYWEPGITDIQKSKNVFLTTARDNDDLVAEYPQLKNKLSSATEIKEYKNDMPSDTSEKSMVVEWYYKRRDAYGKTILHYCKYCNGVVLYASENDERYAESGWYSDGQYPFDTGVVLPLENQITGMGLVDWCKNDQEFVDRLSEALLKNAFANTAPRYLSYSTGTVNEKEMLDYTKPVVHVAGSESSMVQMNPSSMPTAAFNLLQQRIDQLKETSGTRDVATGGTTSGVTAASAIAAMQEAGSKLSRAIISAQYKVFENVILKVIERIRQFYDTPRTYRIIGERGMMKFITYTNEHLKLQEQEDEFGTVMGYRLPIFDIKVEPEKKSPYKKISQNELALQLYQLGIFQPQNADQATACVTMMDFEGKDDVLQTIARNGTLLDAYMQLAQQTLMLVRGTPMELQIQQQVVQVTGQQMPGAASPDGLVSLESSAEPANTAAARQRVAESTSPT